VPAASASAASPPQQGISKGSIPLATASASAFGVSINTPQDVARLSNLMRRPLSSVRVFMNGTPSAWSQSSLLASIPSNGSVSLSFQSGSPSQIQAFLSGHPRTMTCYATYWHEPELDYTTTAQKANYRATWASYGPAIRAAGCKPTLLLMRWSLSPSSGRNWRDWYPAGAVDVLGFDAYNAAAKHGTYGTGSDFISPIQAASAQTGLPWALGEVASDIPAGTSAGNRAAWAHSVAVAAAADPRFAFAEWWDQVSKDGSRDYRLDSAAATSWQP